MSPQQGCIITNIAMPPSHKAMSQASPATIPHANSSTGSKPPHDSTAHPTSDRPHRRHSAPIGLHGAYPENNM
ncbi:MAG: hypothetical protein WDM70_00255 [Nitrosomonadales bacterium]